MQQMKSTIDKLSNTQPEETGRKRKRNESEDVTLDSVDPFDSLVSPIQTETQDSDAEFDSEELLAELAECFEAEKKIGRADF
jgi:hypothetical protein